MLQHKEYWAKRFEKLTDAQLDKGAEYYYNLQKQYRQAIANIEKDIAKWYTRYATENGITLTEAKRLLNGRELAEFRMDVKEYIAKGESLDPKWAKQLEAASTKVHVSRLEALKVQMQQQAEMLYGYEASGVDELVRKVYTDGYYHTAYEIQKGIGVGFDLMQLDTNKIDKLISKPWAADGKNFSERIWNNRAQLVSELENRLTQSIIRGQSPKKVIAEIAERFNVNKSRAGALVMTESAFFASASQRDAFNDLDVEKYEVLATLDSHTSETCRRMDGQVIPMSDYKPGVTAPPFHVRCRSTTVPFFDDEFSALDKRAARGEDGKYYTVPASMKYEDWENVFVKGNGNVDEWKATHSVKSVAEYAEAMKARNKDGQEIIFSEKLHGEKWQASKNVISDLAKEYNTRLVEVQPGAKNAAGDVNLGGVMRLSSSNPVTAIHEFAHSIAMENATKFGLTNDVEFWKDIRKIRTAYRKAVNKDPLIKISYYADADRKIDEFMAEAFAQVKAKELGLPSNYGTDFTYSRQVVAAIDKYFKKLNNTNDKLYRAVIPNRKTATEGFKVVDKATYNKLTKQAISKGANIQIASSEMVEHLKKNAARAVTIGDTIIFAPEITISDLLEELYHFEQNKKGLYSQFDIAQRNIMCEIDAKKYLLSVEKRYKIPLEEMDETRATLKAYEELKQSMIERGEWVNEN